MKLNIKPFSKLHFPLLLILLIFSACEEEEPVVNEENESITVDELAEGELAAVVNEEVLVAETVTATVTEEHFALSVVFSTEKGLTIVTDTLLQTSFDIGGGVGNTAVFALGITNADPESFTADAAPTGGGELVITEINLDALTVSGTFEMLLHEENDPDDAVVISSAAFNNIPFTIQEESQGSFAAIVDGEEWVAEAVTAIVNQQVQVLDVKGTNAAGVDISIFMPSDIEPGVYTLSSNGDYVATVYPEGEDIGTHFSSTGELEIIRHDLENYQIEATFHFEATRTQDEKVYVVEEGAFSYDGYYR